MHFSKTYAEAAKDLPAEWLPYLISYKALKKCISQIVKELEGRGLPVDLLKELRKHDDLRRAEEASISPATPSTIELPSPSDNGPTMLQLQQQPRSLFQQVIHSGSQHKVLYTFADSSHPCLLLIVNEGGEKELFSNENSPGSTAPTSPVLIPDAPYFATRDLTTDDSNDETTTAAKNELMQRLTQLTLGDMAMLDASLQKEAASISPTCKERVGAEEEEEEDLEEDRRHEQREQEEMDRHFSSRNRYADPKTNTCAATTSSPRFATTPAISIPRPISAPATLTTLTNDNASSRELFMAHESADERDAKTFEELSASAVSADSGKSSKKKQRKRYRRSFATVYADDGQAVRIARFEDRQSEKGLTSHGSRNPIIELESKTSQVVGKIESCPCKTSDLGHVDENGNRVRTVKVTLSTDVTFFNTILSAIAKLAEFQNTIKTVYEQKIRRVGDLVASVATPHSSTFGFNRSSDLYAWREIMATFAEEEIWFDESRTEMRGDNTKLEKCKARLDHWEIKALQQCYPKLKLDKSKIAFAEFLKLNRDILAMKQFRELNKMAIGKILKKHDKRTMLISRSGFETLIATNTFISESLIHGLSYSIASQLMTIIPQPQDYSCPVCLSISWKPIRLNCGHIFCVRCLIKAQRRKMTNCPLCRRSGSVEQANAGNLDVPLMNLMQLYFPKEIKEKRRENAREVLEYEPTFGAGF